MRNLKKFLALVLAMMMVFSLMLTANAAKSGTYDDSEGVIEAYNEAVEVLKGMGVMQGEGGTNNFKPAAEIDRSQAAVIIYRLHTGDTGTANVGLYINEASDRFSDVSPSHWAAGYIGYCANQGIIKGDGEGHFLPDGKLDGYQLLALLLRVSGYRDDQFPGSDWRIQVASGATQLGVLKGVDSANYGGSLYKNVRRDVMAQLIFNAFQLPECINGSTLHMVAGTAGGELVNNDSLAVKHWGLTSATGIVLGNQATGEKNTLVGFTARTGVVADGDPNTNEYIKNDDGNYKYGSNTGTNMNVGFTTNTGLNLFGHKATVWYDGRGWEKGFNASDDLAAGTMDGANATKSVKSYAVVDKAVHTATVFAKDAILSADNADANGSDSLLGAAAIKAGFDMEMDSDSGNDDANEANTTANFSNRYSKIDTSAVAGTPDTAAATNWTSQISPVNMYELISNNDDKTVDVVIALNAEVGRITEVNSTSKTPYLTLGVKDSGGNNSALTNSDSITDRIFLKRLTSASVKKVGELVTAWQVWGTAFAYDATISSADDCAKVMYETVVVKTSTKTVESFVKEADAVTIDGIGEAGKNIVSKVNFTDGTSKDLSGITWGTASGDDYTSKIVNKALPVLTSDNVKATVSYTVYEDKMGRFISMVPANDATFIYATFADFEMGALGSGDSRYTITGVNENGQIIPLRDLTAIEDGSTMKPIRSDITNTYNKLPITRKDFGNSGTNGNSTLGNQIKGGKNTGYKLSSEGQLYMDHGAYELANGSIWSISKNNLALGVARVTDSHGTDYLLTGDTQFYVVTGAGNSDLKVDPYKGVTALLGSSASVDISAPGRVGDQVIFWIDETQYGTTQTSKNHIVTKVILSDTNLNRWDAATMFYNFNKTDSTGLKLPGTNNVNVEQYKLYANGVEGTYYIDVSKSTKRYVSSEENGVNGNAEAVSGAAWGNKSGIQKDTFYNLVVDRTVNGVTIYRAVALDARNDLIYSDGYNTGVEYKYVAVNDLNFANLVKGSGDLIYSVAGMTICDAEYNNGKLSDKSSVKLGREEITTQTELNNAISVKQSDDANTVYGITVAVVYNNTSVVTVYITRVETN